MKISTRSVKFVILAVTALAPMSAMAQTAEPPALLRGVPGIEQAPSVGGLQAWSMQGEDFLWLVAPDGKSLISGYVFDEQGNDISSAAGGHETMSFNQFMDYNTEADISLVDPVTAPPVKLTSEATEDTPAMDLSALNNDSVIQSLPETTRNQVLIRLVEALRPVSTEDEFKSVMLAWREYVKTVAAGGPTDAPFPEVTVAPQASEAPVTSQVPSSPQSLPAPQVQDTPPSLAMPEPALTDMGDALKAPDADPVQAEPDAVVTSQVAQVEAQETQVAAPELTFLDDTRNNTMWFSMGSTTAPVVYAYIDPTCPYCAAAMKELDPQISAGSLQLRIVLAPLVSEGAPDVIAGILTSADPIQTFREHELAVANRTTSPVTPTAFPELGAEMANGIRANYDMVMTYELPGVPFFVFNTEEGEKYLSGVPDADSFASALPDDFTGSN